MKEKNDKVIEVPYDKDEVQTFNRVTFQHDIDCAARLKKFDAIVEGMNFSKEWFDGIEEFIHKTLDSMEEYEYDSDKINDRRRTINYLLKLRDINRKLSEVSTNNGT